MVGYYVCKTCYISACALGLHGLVKNTYCDYSVQYCSLQCCYNKEINSWVYLFGYRGKCTNYAQTISLYLCEDLSNDVTLTNTPVFHFAFSSFFTRALEIIFC